MSVHEIRVSRTEVFTRASLCDVWTLRRADDPRQVLMEVPASSITHAILDMLAFHLEHFELTQAIKKVSVETTLKMLNDGEAFLASQILGNSARIKEGM